MSKTKLFSVTKEDCRFDTFRAGGNGGQNSNKVSAGVRCVHIASGAVGEARDTRSQLINKRSAFKRMAETKEFQLWLKLETARQLGKPSIDEIIDTAMDPKNFVIEFRDQDHIWQKENA